MQTNKRVLQMNEEIEKARAAFDFARDVERSAAEARVEAGKAYAAALLEHHPLVGKAVQYDRGGRQSFLFQAVEIRWGVACAVGGKLKKDGAPSLIQKSCPVDDIVEAEQGE
jgi:hypothetical protein